MSISKNKNVNGEKIELDKQIGAEEHLEDNKLGVIPEFEEEQASMFENKELVFSSIDMAGNVTGKLMEAMDVSNLVMSKEAQEWNRQYKNIKGIKNRLINGKKDAYIQQVGDDEKAWEKARSMPVEFDVSTEMLEALSKEKLAEAWKDVELDGREEGYMPPSAQAVDEERKWMIGKFFGSARDNDYAKTLVDGAETGATLLLLKENGLWGKAQLLEITKRFYKYSEFKENEKWRALEDKKREVVKGESKVGGLEQEYEKEINNSCYGCAGAKIINQLLGKKVLNQGMIRSFIPRFLSEEEVSALNPVSEDYRSNRIDEIEEFAGASKDEIGNISTAGDVLFDDKKYGGLGSRDIALCRRVYIVDDSTPDVTRDNILESIKEKIHERVKAGQMVTIFANNHYVTVTGISDDKIYYLDSKAEDPKQVQNADLSTYLKGGKEKFSLLELTWAMKIDEASGNKLKNDFTGFEIDDKTGEIVRKNDVWDMDEVAHRSGIVIGKSPDEMVRDGNGDIARHMKEFVCLHRGSFMTAEQFEAWKKKDESTWKNIESNRDDDEYDSDGDEIEDGENEVAQEERVEQQEEQDEIVYNNDEIVYNNDEIVRMIPGQENLVEAERQNENADANVNEQAERQNEEDERPNVFFYEPDENQEDQPEIDAIIDNEEEKKQQQAPVEQNAQQQAPVEGQQQAPVEQNAGQQAQVEQNARQQAPVEQNAQQNAQVEQNAQQQANQQVQQNVVNLDGGQNISLEDGQREYDIHVANLKDRMQFVVQKHVQNKQNNVNVVANANVQINGVANANAGNAAANANAAAAPANIVLNEELALLTMRVAAINGDDDVEARHIYDGLNLPTEGLLTDERKKTYIIAAERVFHAALSCDVSKYLLASPNDVKKVEVNKGQICHDRNAYMKAREMLDIAPFLEKIIDQYAEYGRGRMGALSNRALDDVKEQCKRMKNVKKLVDSRFLNALNADVANQLTEEEEADLRTLLAEKNNRDVLQNNKIYQNRIKSNRRLDEIERRNKAKENLENGIYGSNFPIKVASARQIKKKHGSSFKERGLTVRKREEEMEKNGTVLYKKARNADLLINKANEARDAAARGRRRLCHNVKMALFDDEKLEAVSAFFTDNDDSNTVLVRRLAGKMNSFNNDMTREDEKDAKTMVMDKLAREFLSIDIQRLMFDEKCKQLPPGETVDSAMRKGKLVVDTELSLMDDETIVKNAAILESVMLKVRGFKKLLDLDPDYVERMKTFNVSVPKMAQKGASRQNAGGNNDRTESVTVLEAVARQFEKLGRLTDYYRARKLVITDSYYMSHYDDEIGTDETKRNLTKEQKKIAQLIHTSMSYGDKCNGNVGESIWFHEAKNEDEKLTKLEEDHKKRAFSTARLDMSRCTKDEMTKLMEEMNTFRDRANGEFVNDMSEDEIEQACEGLSDNFKNILKCSMRSGRGLADATKEWSQKKNKKTIDTVYNLLKHDSTDEIGRLKDYDDKLAFSNMTEGRVYEFGSMITRQMDFLGVYAKDMMVSREELLEVLEGLQAGLSRDIDMTAPDQVGKAEELYLKNFVKLFRIMHSAQCRYLNTYGMVMAQLPPLVLNQALGKRGFESIMLGNSGNGVEDMLKASSVTINGEKKKMFDYLVEQGYLKKNEVDFALNVSDMQSGLNYVNNQAGISVKDFLAFNNEDFGDFDMENLQQGFCDSIFKGAKTLEGEGYKQLSKNEVMKVWEDFELATASIGLKTQAKDSETAMLKSYHPEGVKYTSSMNELERLVFELGIVDTSGHSEKYNVMYLRIGALRNNLSHISQKVAGQNQNNLSPKDMESLRISYDEALRSCLSYLKGKNRKHSNMKYRRRYNVVEDIIKQLEQDYGALSEKKWNVSYRLEDALDEDKLPEEIVVEKENGAVDEDHLAKRHHFTKTINTHESKEIIHTEDKAFPETNKSIEDLREMKDLPENEYGEFTQFGRFLQAEEVLEFIEKDFFEKENQIDYFGAISNDPDMKDVDVEQCGSKLKSNFEVSLKNIWEKYSKDFNKIDATEYSFDKNFSVKYKALPQNMKDEIINRVVRVGSEWYKNYKIVTMSGIRPGKDLAKRNVATRIMAEALGAESNVANAYFGRIKVQNQGQAQPRLRVGKGVVVEMESGMMDERELTEGITEGTIIYDNEKDIIEQLARIQIMDYICGNVNRRMKSFSFKMEQTEEVDDRGRSIRRIKDIVCLDNDLSFGDLSKDKLDKKPIGTLDKPENMRYISAKMANNVLKLKKRDIFVKLGMLLSDRERNAMWSRVENLQKLITDAKKGAGNGLRILREGDFNNLHLGDLADYKKADSNIFYMFDKATGSHGIRQGNVIEGENVLGVEHEEELEEEVKEEVEEEREEELDEEREGERKEEPEDEYDELEIVQDGKVVKERIKVYRNNEEYQKDNASKK